MLRISLRGIKLIKILCIKFETFEILVSKPYRMEAFFLGNWVKSRCNSVIKFMSDFSFGGERSELPLFISGSAQTCAGALLQLISFIEATICRSLPAYQPLYLLIKKGPCISLKHMVAFSS